MSFKDNLKAAVERQTLALNLSKEEIAKPDSALYDNVIDAASTTENVPVNVIKKEVEQTMWDWEILLEAAWRYLELLD